MDDEDSLRRQNANFIRKANALISFYLNVPFPEELDDEAWMEKYRQVEYLSELGLLGIKTNNGNG